MKTQQGNIQIRLGNKHFFHELVYALNLYILSPVLLVILTSIRLVSLEVPGFFNAGMVETGNKSNSIRFAS
jgi:hypothetical protein